MNNNVWPLTGNTEMNERHNHRSLDWIAPGLNEAINNARRLVESYLSGNNDKAKLLECSVILTDVHAALERIDLPSACLLTEQLTILISVIVEDRCVVAEEAYQALLGGMAQLPSYLIRIRSNQREQLSEVIAIINDVRAASNLPLMLDKHVFALPDSQTAELFAQTSCYVDKDQAQILLTQCQTTLASVSKQSDNYRQTVESLNDSLNNLSMAFAADESASSVVVNKVISDKLFSCLQTLLLAAKADSSCFSLSAKYALTSGFKLVQMFLQADANADFDQQFSDHVLSELLFSIAIADSNVEAVKAFQQQYGLLAALSIEHPSELLNLGTPDADTMDVVFDGLCSDLSVLKNALERRAESAANAVSFEEMAAMASTLKYTMQLAQYGGWAEKMQSVGSQLTQMHESDSSGDADQTSAIQNIAEQLHAVEYGLRQLHLGGSRSESEISALHEAKKSIALIRENLAARSASEINFFEDEQLLDFDPLKDISQQLKQVVGAMQMMSIGSLVNAINCAEIYLQQTIIAGKNEEAADKLIDALAAIESYIEAAKYQQQDRVADWLAAAIDLLGGSSPAAVTSQINASSEANSETNSAAASALDTSNVEDAPALTISSERQTLDVELDEDIVEIFLEEAEEVIESLLENVGVWAAELQNDERMADIRRGFHTLKGSGRMAGAEHVGDVAWSIENLINRMSDGSMPIDQPRADLVVEAVAYMPHLVESFNQRLIPFAAPMQSMIDRALILTDNKDGTVEAGVTLNLLEAAQSVQVTSIPNNSEVSETAAVDTSATEMEITELTPAEESVPVLSDELPIVTEDTTEAIGDEIVDESSEQPNEEISEEFLQALPDYQEPEHDAIELSSFENFTGEAQEDDLGDTDLNQTDASSEATADADNTEAEELPTVELNEEMLSTADEAEELVFADSAEDDHYLQAIFISELEVQLSVLHGYLDTCNTGSTTYPSEAVERALHTIVGGARIAANQLIAELFAPAEILVSLIRKRGAIHSSELQLLENVCQCTQTLLNTGCLGQVKPADEQQALEFVDQLNQAVADDLENAGDEKDMVVDNDLIFDANGFLQNWRTGGTPGSELETMVSVLEQLGQAAADGQQDPIEQHCEALIRTYKCFAGTDETISYQLDGSGLHYQAYNTLLQAHDALDDMLDRVAAGQNVERHPSLELLEDLLASEQQLQAQLQRHAMVDDGKVNEVVVEGIDQEIVSIFLDESEDLIEDVEAGVQQWLSNRKDTSYLETLLRPLHTIKGGARMAGLEEIGNISHEFETLLLSASNGDIKTDSQFFKKAGKFVAALIASVSDIRSKLAGGTAAEAPVDSNQAAEANNEDEKRKSEVVRVSSDLLEQLVNLAGETSISRSLVEEQVSDFSQNIDEIDSTIERLKEQLRRLEIEMEAQIEFRKEQVESEGQEEFDPLEMDRYSQVQQLSKSLIESASDLKDLKSTLSEKTRDMETLLLQQSRINTSLQEGLMRTRTVPLSRYIIPRLRRIVRQVSGELDKPVSFEVNNAGGELDRGMIERMVAPLEHVLRNAIDHGIESDAQRVEQGKPEQGAIRLNIRREGGDVVLELSDDGKGIDVQAVKKKALAKGLIDKDSQLSDEEIMRFIFDAGISTAKELTQLSGRGVGMDVVQSEIADLGGSVEMTSKAGQGTMFTFRLPFTVSMNRALLVCAGGETLAVPLDSIEGIVRVSPFELEEYYGENAAEFFYAGQKYDFSYLGTLINNSNYQANPDMLSALPVLLVRGGDKFVALQVDRLLGSREIVVKSLGAQFANLEGIAGATVLGDGSVVMIADLVALVRAEQNLNNNSNVISLDKSRDRLLAMVVDDSVTVRKVTSRLLERRGMDVVTAKDGLDAMLQLDDVKPDFILLDIEMPRMDGFEVVARIRNDAKLADIPIIMITSRTGEKHRERALGLGANCFLGKPYQEAVLFEAINEVLPSTLIEEQFGT